MSVSVDIYPELLLAGEPLRVTVRNPTNDVADIQVRFYKDGDIILQIVVEEVEAGNSADVFLSDSDSGLSEYAGSAISAVAGLVTGGSGGGEFWL